MRTVDAVVIGAGHNGLVAANVLADAGWDVVVLEAQPVPGGAVRSAELIEPGYLNDCFSAFYPLGAASPVLAGLELDRFGLRWARSPLVLAHPFPDGRCAVLSQDLRETAASLDEFAPGDGDAWRALYALWERIGDDVCDGLFQPFPPVRAGARIAGRLGIAGTLDLARLAVLPVRRLAEEQFSGEGGGLLIGGNAMHTDVPPESAGSALFGWLLTCLGQQVGFPAPEGGAGKLVDALIARLTASGGRVQCNRSVERIIMKDARAVGVRTAGGQEIAARRAVIADVAAPRLYLDLIGRASLPSRLVRDIERFHWDNATVKVDWTLDKPIPWCADAARRAGTVHVADGMSHLTIAAAQMSAKVVPARPPLVVGQMTTTDPSRSPEGTETAWAYAHVPQEVEYDEGGVLAGTWGPTDAEMFADRMENQIERLAPGFRQSIRGRYVATPHRLESADVNLVGGSMNTGTAQIHQMLFLRPTPGLARAETVIDGLYLASASAHPGGGVHGACGANAAQAALRRSRLARLALRRLYK